MVRRKRSGDFFLCPHCGAEVATGSPFCRECGASEESGWSEDEFGYAGGDADFDYDEYLAREFPEHATSRRGARPRWFVTLIVALLCLAMLLWAILR